MKKQKQSPAKVLPSKAPGPKKSPLEKKIERKK